MSTAPTIEHIYCYPVKGLGGYALSETTLSPDKGIPFDRQYGLAFTPNATDSLKKADTPWRPWEFFLSLKKTPACVHFSAHIKIDNGTPLLTIRHRNGEQASGNPDDPQHRRALEQFIQDGLQRPAAEPVRLIDSDQPLWDDKVSLSLVNASTAVALGDGLPLSEMVTRLRPNIVFTGMPAWQEESQHGSRVRSSQVQLKIMGGIPRCAATKVNPQTAERDFNIPQVLVKTRGHNECGIFASIEGAGKIAIGSPLHFAPAL